GQSDSSGDGDGRAPERRRGVVSLVFAEEFIEGLIPAEFARRQRMIEAEQLSARGQKHVVTGFAREARRELAEAQRRFIAGDLDVGNVLQVEELHILKAVTEPERHPVAHLALGLNEAHKAVNTK